MYIPAKAVLCYAYLEKVQKDVIIDKNPMTPKSGKVMYFHENIK